MSDSQIPVARKTGLVIQEMPGEVLVYDLETNKAHCLNQTAAAVWKSCNGKNSVADISGLLAGTVGSPVQDDLIRLAIDQLNENNLLENNPPANFNTQNRREVIKKIGLAAVVALPIVTSLVAPKAAQAGSTCGGNVCTCNSGTITNGTCASSACASGCTGCKGTDGQTTGVCG